VRAEAARNAILAAFLIFIWWSKLSHRVALHLVRWLLVEVGWSFQPFAPPKFCVSFIAVDAAVVAWRYWLAVMGDVSER
jgi:hypothetical protein